MSGALELPKGKKIFEDVRLEWLNQRILEDLERVAQDTSGLAVVVHHVNLPTHWPGGLYGDYVITTIVPHPFTPKVADWVVTSNLRLNGRGEAKTAIDMLKQYLILTGGTDDIQVIELQIQTQDFKG